MRQLWQRFTYLISVALFVMVSTVMSVSPVYADSNNYGNNGGGNDKNSPTYYVCNYTGTPGQNEQLEEANPQTVNASDINENQVTVGTYYTNNMPGSNGRSYVLAIKNGQNPPACPAADDLTPAAPTFTDVCGIANDTYTIPNEAGVEYQINHNTVSAGTYNKTGLVTITAAPQHNYILSGTTTWSYNFTNLPCAVPVTPVAVTFNDVCGTANDTYTIPSQAGVEYQVNGNTVATGTYAGTGHVTVTAVALAGYVLSGNITSWSQNFATTPCVVQVPATPAKTDPCGPNNASWAVPTDSSTIMWTLVNGDLIATTTPGNVFQGGITTHNYGAVHDSNTPCIISLPSAPSQTDPCGPNNATWDVPTDSSTVTWSVTWNGHLTATAAVGYVFSNGSITHDYGVATDHNTPCVVHVTPTTPVFNDECGTANDTYTIPGQTGVEYKVNGFPVWLAGTFPGFGTVMINAYPAHGYVLDGTTIWSHTFTNDSCKAPCKHQSQPQSHCKHHQQQPQPQAVQPDAVTFTAPTCKNPLFGIYTAPVTANVIYKDGSTVVSGDNTVSVPLAGSGTVTITAYPESNAFILTGTTSWTQTFTTPEGCGGGGQILPVTGGQGAGPVVTTTSAPVVTPTAPQQLTNTGVNVSISSFIALILSLTAAGIMFGNRKRSNA